MSTFLFTPPNNNEQPKLQELIDFLEEIKKKFEKTGKNVVLDSVDVFNCDALKIVGADSCEFSDSIQITLSTAYRKS